MGTFFVCRDDGEEFSGIKMKTGPPGGVASGYKLECSDRLTG